jgi:hypothetical protein
MKIKRNNIANHWNYDHYSDVKKMIDTAVEAKHGVPFGDEYLLLTRDQGDGVYFRTWFQGIKHTLEHPPLNMYR